MTPAQAFTAEMAALDEDPPPPCPGCGGDSPPVPGSDLCGVCDDVLRAARSLTNVLGFRRTAEAIQRIHEERPCVRKEVPR